MIASFLFFVLLNIPLTSSQEFDEGFLSLLRNHDNGRILAQTRCQNAVVGLYVVDTTSGTTVGELQDTLVIGQDDAYTIRAGFSECSEDPISQIAWTMNGHLRGDGTHPYAVNGDDGSGGYKPYNFTEGHYVISATPISESMILGREREHSFTVIFERDEAAAGTTLGSTSFPTFTGEFILESPSSSPSVSPSSIPSDIPSSIPSDIPSSIPSDIPSEQPTLSPSEVPTVSLPPTIEPCDCCNSTQEFPVAPEFIPTYEELLDYLAIDVNTTILSREPAREQWNATVIDSDCLEGECPNLEEEDLSSHFHFHLRRALLASTTRQLQEGKQISDAFKKLIKKAAENPFRAVTCCSCGMGTLVLEGICALESGADKPWPTFEACLCDLVHDNSDWEFACNECLDPLTTVVAAKVVFGC
jgi:hypothetical protein